MKHLGDIIWIAGLLLEVAILTQSVRSGLFKRFPIFYVYLFVVFASQGWLWYAHKHTALTYFWVFWATQTLTIFLGYGVVLEIMHHALIHYPGAERLARISGFAVFATLFAGLGISWLLAKNPFALDHWYEHMNTLERDFRMLQAIFLALIAVVALYYRIELGKNVQGLLVGLGIFVSASIVSPELLDFFGNRFQPIYRELQSVVYLATLGIWSVALWSYVAVPVPPRNAPMEVDYEKMAQRTREGLRAARSYLTGGDGR